jgi:sensor domain CHASE-containing protein
MGNLLRHWQLGAALLALACAWGYNTAQIAFSQERQESVETRVTVVEKAVSEIKQSISSQAATSKAQQQSIDRIDRNIEALLREMRRQ